MINDTGKTCLCLHCQGSLQGLKLTRTAINYNNFIMLFGKIYNRKTGNKIFSPQS